MLNIDFTFLFTILNLLVLYFFLRKFLFGRVTQFMDARAAGIAADLEKAQADKDQAQQYLSQQQALLQDATAERGRILETARKRAGEGYEETILQAQQEAARIVAKAEADVQRDKEKVMQEMQNQVVSLALSAASKVLQENMDTEKNRELVGQFLEDEGVA